MFFGKVSPRILTTLAPNHPLGKEYQSFIFKKGAKLSEAYQEIRIIQSKQNKIQREKPHQECLKQDLNNISIQFFQQITLQLRSNKEPHIISTGDNSGIYHQSLFITLKCLSSELWASCLGIIQNKEEHIGNKSFENAQFTVKIHKNELAPTYLNGCVLRYMP